jgi:S1-C subfamily serine protease
MISKSQGPIDGIIGFPVFARYRMTIDYQARQMTFVPNGFQPVDAMQVFMESLLSAKTPSSRVLAPAALWGLVVNKAADDEQAGVSIKEVLTNSAAAEADLHAGDRLLTLDGRWTDSVNDCYFAASKVAAGTDTVVLVRRDGKERQLVVKPRLGW